MTADVLLLDAGNTIVFADYAAIAAVLQGAGQVVDAAAVAASQAAANRAYVSSLQAGAHHEEGWHTLMRTWIRGAGVAEARAAEAMRRLRAAHDEFNLWRHVPDDVRAALARLHAELRLGVVSNSEGALQGLLERLGLAHFFDAVIDSGVEGVRKPDPEIFLRACRRLDVEPARCLYAGDLPEVDVEGARAAGLAAVLVDAFDAYPDYTAAPRFASLGELADALLSRAL